MPLLLRQTARRVASVLCCMFLLGVACAPAQDSSLSLDTAQRAAVARSREAAGKEAAASAASALGVVASRLPDPTLQLGIDNLPVNGPDAYRLTSDFMTMRRIGLAQSLTREDKRRAGAARYEREASQRLAERDAVIAEIRSQTAMAWLERHFAERMLVVVDEQWAAAKSEIKAIEGAYRAGRGTQAEVIAAHDAVLELEDRRSEQIQRIARSKLALGRWVGELAQTTLAAPPALDALQISADSLAHRAAQHPAVIALQRQHEVALADADLARANRKADWTVDVSYAQRGAAYSNMISFGVSIPLQWDQKRRQDLELAARFATASETLALREEVERSHVAQTQAMLSDWRALRARAVRYGSERVPLALERVRATLAVYAGGKGSLADLTAARQAVLATRLRALELEAAAAQLWAQLSFLIPPEAAADPLPTTPAAGRNSQ